MSNSPLEISHISKTFGGLKVVQDLSFRLERQGQIVGLVGPNGAGKTTLFNIITGLVRPDSGTVSVGGTVVTGMAAHEVAACGISRTFQDTRLFDRLTVEENLYQGRLTTRREGVVRSLLRPARHRSQADRETVEDALSLCGLGAIRNQPVRLLTHAQRSALGIGMISAASPTVALMDEPFGGMNEAEIDTTMGIVRAVAARGVAVLLVEHVMAAVMGLSERIEVLNFGQHIASGTPAETAANPAVIEAYLGVQKAS